MIFCHRYERCMVYIIPPADSLQLFLSFLNMRAFWLDLGISRSPSCCIWWSPYVKECLFVLFYCPSHARIYKLQIFKTFFIYINECTRLKLIRDLSLFYLTIRMVLLYSWLWILFIYWLGFNNFTVYYNWMVINNSDPNAKIQILRLSLQCFQTDLF